MDKRAMYDTRIDHSNGPIRIANFSGTGMYRQRSALINLYPEDAERLKALGYNVKYYSRNPEDEPIPQIDVKIKFRKMDGTPVEWPPTIYSVIDGVRSEPLDENSIAELDRWVRGQHIKDCHLVINPSFGNNSQTAAAYVKTAYFIVDTTGPSVDPRNYDPFAEMYGN